MEKDGEKSYSECLMYDLDWDSVSGDTSFSALSTVYGPNGTKNAQKVPCKYGWTFDHSVYTTTVVTEVSKFV